MADSVATAAIIPINVPIERETYSCSSCIVEVIQHPHCKDSLHPFKFTIFDVGDQILHDSSFRKKLVHTIRSQHYNFTMVHTVQVLFASNSGWQDRVIKS